MYAAQHASQEHATEARRGLAGAVASDAGVAVAVVRLRGAPFDVNRAEIAALFGAHGVEEHSVFLAPRVADGKPSGEAFVAVTRGEAAAKDAIKTLDRKEIRGRWVELFAATPAELAARCKAGLAAAHRPDAADRGVVRVGGLPFMATRADVARLFEAGRAALAASLGAEGSCVALRDEAGIFLPSTPDRRPSGLAFLVVAGGAEAAALATRALDGASLGDRAVVAAPATMCELYAALGDDALESRCALLRGLPFSFCGPGHVEDQFLHGLAVERLQLCAAHGRPDGNAYVMFRTVDDAIRALARNRADLAGRFVEVVAVPRREFDRGAQWHAPGHAFARPPPPSYRGPPPQPPPQPPPPGAAAPPRPLATAALAAYPAFPERAPGT